MSDTRDGGPGQTWLTAAFDRVLRAAGARTVEDALKVRRHLVELVMALECLRRHGVPTEAVEDFFRTAVHARETWEAVRHAGRVPS